MAKAKTKVSFMTELKRIVDSDKARSHVTAADVERIWSTGFRLLARMSPAEAMAECGKALARADKKNSKAGKPRSPKKAAKAKK